jgi:dihydrodipicolinate synthase/N-acetylneuraminate lyase
VNKKSAIDRIDNHEKICRLMQKQTFDQIKEIKDRILRLEKMIMAAGGAIILALIANMM